MQMQEPFTEVGWMGDLSLLLEKHELDQIAGIDADMLAAFMAMTARLLAKLVKERDRGMPGALNAVERSELAALRRVHKLQEVLLAQKEETINEQAESLVNLGILFKDALAQRDRALGVVK